MPEGKRQATHDVKTERLPEPDGAFIGAHDEIELHGAITPRFGVFEIAQKGLRQNGLRRKTARKCRLKRFMSDENGLMLRGGSYIAWQKPIKLPVSLPDGSSEISGSSEIRIDWVGAIRAGVPRSCCFSATALPCQYGLLLILTDDLCTVDLPDTGHFGIGAFLTEQAQQGSETIWKKVRACGNTGMGNAGMQSLVRNGIGDAGHRCTQASAPLER